MIDQPADPSFGHQEALAKVLASSLPDERKKLLIRRLILEREQLEQRFQESVDEMIAGAERMIGGTS